MSTKVMHYGLTREEFASRAGKHPSCFDNRLYPLCGNGSFHASVTRRETHVNCPACMALPPVAAVVAARNAKRTGRKGVDLTKPAAPVAPFAVAVPYDPRPNAVIVEETRAALAAERQLFTFAQKVYAAHRAMVKARSEKLRADAPLSPGFNTRNGVRAEIMMTWSGPQFRNERWADEVDGAGIRHTGWFADPHQDEKYRGFVFSLSHGRFGAGYESSSSGERVYFLDVFGDERAAASHADDEARYVAEEEFAYQERRDAAVKLDDEISETIRALRLHIAARNLPVYEYDRSYIADTIADLRKLRADRAEYSDIEV